MGMSVHAEQLPASSHKSLSMLVHLACPMSCLSYIISHNLPPISGGLPCVIRHPMLYIDCRTSNAVHSQPLFSPLSTLQGEFNLQP
jgi:hypothetical protein